MHPKVATAVDNAVICIISLISKLYPLLIADDWKTSIWITDLPITQEFNLLTARFSSRIPSITRCWD